LLLQDKIQRGDRTPGIVKPREDVVASVGAEHDRLVSIQKKPGRKRA
jgi:hypothetical protein